MLPMETHRTRLIAYHMGHWLQPSYNLRQQVRKHIFQQQVLLVLLGQEYKSDQLFEDVIAYLDLLLKGVLAYC
jgi:hypothetical protein